ncbi:MAG: hypothetical protein AAF456_16230 [Planctomycetota bacterium]
MRTNRCLAPAFAVALICILPGISNGQDETPSGAPAADGSQVAQPEPSILDPDPVRDEINQMIRASGTAGGVEGAYQTTIPLIRNSVPQPFD